MTLSLTQCSACQGVGPPSRALEPKSGVEHSGNNSGGDSPGSETVDRCPRMCKRVFVLRAQASPIFAPQLSCKSSL